MSSLEKLNKIIKQDYPEIYEKWMDELKQKKIKKLFKNKRKEKDSESVKTHTPYIKFCMDERTGVKDKHPDLDTKDITAKLGQLWNKYKTEDPDYLKDNYGYTPK